MEWPILVFSLLLVVVEQLIYVITELIPSPAINFFDSIIQRIFSLFNVSSPSKMDEKVRQVARGKSFVEICSLFGYKAEEHVVQTSDGYILGVHRIVGSKQSPGSSPHRSGAPVVYLHHGLLMNSEVWVVNLDPSRCLPFVLADLGYDVWLGNNRGNKYSKKHISKKTTDKDFWNFSIDDFALYDIPDTIDYILKYVQQKNLAYIGFSQGTAQGFAALSVNPDLNEKVRLFIALAPAMAPPGLNNQIVDSLTKASPSLIYLFFGTKAILPSTAFWQSIMYPPLFVKTIDLSLDFLFRWSGKNISYAQKVASYAHLYSYTSVKSVVHWFQIMRNGRFHMYDDAVQNPLVYDPTYYRVAPFPTKNIKTPVVLIYGDTDSLVDIKLMLSELPQGTAHVGIKDHEHLDILWGKNIDTLIFPYVLNALKRSSLSRSRAHTPPSPLSPVNGKLISHHHSNSP